MLFSGLRKQNTSTYPLYFMLINSTDHITGLTGKTGSVVITICKLGGSFASPHTNTCVEVGNGLYYITADNVDFDTLGPLFIHAKDAASDPYDSKYDIVNYDPFTFNPDVNQTKIAGTTITAQMLAAWVKFFDKASPTGTVNSLPDAVAGANNGLATTNGTKLNQTVDLTAGQSIACSDKTGFSLSATGADLILKSSTFIQAIVAAINEFATYGLTAINTLLITTGIKAATIPNATVGGYAAGQDPATLLLVTPANKLATDAANCVKVPDTQKIDVNTIKTKGVTVDAGGTTFPSVVGSSTLAAGAKMDLQDAPNATALNAVADAYLDRANAIETGITPRSAHKLELASAAGKLSGAATTTVTIRNVGDSKNRIVATVDADGNRSAITTDVT